MTSTWLSAPWPRSTSATTIVPSGDQLGLRPFWPSERSSPGVRSQAFSLQPPSPLAAPKARSFPSGDQESPLLDSEPPSETLRESASRHTSREVVRFAIAIQASDFPSGENRVHSHSASSELPSLVFSSVPRSRIQTPPDSPLGSA